MKRKFAWLLVLVLALGMFAGCGGQSSGGGSESSGGETSAEASGHDSATIIETMEWQGTDTFHVSSSGYTVRFLVDSLITVLDDGTYCPNICESFSVAEDGSSISFVIPEDFQFADGTPLTPEDVKRSLEFGIETSQYNEDYKNISEVKVDGQTVICMLDYWNPATLYCFSRNMVPILPAEQIDTMSMEDLLWGALPYGAYSVEEYVEGSHVTLKANPYYKTNNPAAKNQGPATVETLTIRFMTDPFAIASSLSSDEAVYVAATDPSGLTDIQSKNAKLKTQERNMNRAYWLQINESVEPFNDANVRKAIALAINRDDMSSRDDILCEPEWLFNASSSVDYAQEAADYNKETYNYNKEEAIKLLEEAGWKDTDGDGFVDKDGKKFSVKINMSRPNAIPTILQIQLKDIGIEVAEILEGEGASDELAADTYQLDVEGYGWGDVSGTLPYIMYDTNNPSLDADAFLETVDKGIQCTDPAERQTYFAEAQKMAIDSNTMIPLISQQALFIYNEDYLDDDAFFASVYIKPNELK